MANIDVNFIAGRMNKDFDERVVPAGEYIDALNIRVGSTENNSVGAVENTKGNIKLTSLQYNGVPLVGARCIGAYEDGSNETLYWLVTSATVDMVVSFNTEKSLLKYHVVSEDVLNFDPEYLVTGINLIDNLLFWTDNLNPPRKININRNYPEPIGGVDQIDESDISVIVAPPSSAPEISLLLVPREENYMTNKFISFAYRYKYKDGEYSALSQFSDIAFEPGGFGLDYSTFENSGMENIFNSVNVKFNTGSDNVVGIDICFKLSDSSVINVVEKYNKSQEGWADNKTEQITFTNKKVYTTLTESELLRVFDNVPRLAKAQTVMGNRLMYGNYVDGYNITDEYGNQIDIDYDLDLMSENIGFVELPVSLDTGSNYTIDPSSTKTINDAQFNIDLTGVPLISGSYLSINITLQHESYSGDASYTNPPRNDFEYDLVFNIQKNYSSVYELATSQEFIDAISTHKVYADACTGTSVTDAFNCQIIAKSGWTEIGTGIIDATGSFTISSSLGSDIISIQIPAIKFGFETSPGVFVYAYEYLSNTNTSASFSAIGSNQSLHSNRDYEVAIVYMDEYSRSSTALVDTNNTIFVPPYNSDKKNYIRASIKSKAPSWATKYKFVVKPSKSQYQVVYSNVFFQEDSGFTWFKLEGDNRSKVQEDSTLIVKADSNGVMKSLIKTKVLALEAQPRDFIKDNKNSAGQDIIEPAGMYMRLKASNFSSEYTENSFIDEGEISEAGSYANLNYPCYIDNPLFGQAGELQFAPYDIPAGSLININFTLTRDAAGDSCGNRTYVFNKSFTASQYYTSLYNFIISDQINLEAGDSTGGDATVNKNDFNKNLVSPYTGNINAIPGTNQYEFQYDTTNGRLFFVIKSGTPNCSGKKSRVICHIQVQRTESLIVFETEAADANDETYFEGSESFDIINGYHQGNVTNQSSGIPAVVDLNFFDCFSFGNGVESYKIGDSLTGAPFYLGSRVTAVSQEEFKEAHRYAGITYSGIYNEETNVNKLNEFNLALANFKDCEKSFGPINILHGRKTDVLTLQEDKISYVLAGKNLLSDAAGGGAITSVPEVLGTQISRIEEFGISNDAASFASWGEDIYFTDTKRTSVINLKGGASQSDNLIPISRLGMNGWFRDNFKNKINYQKLGGYDPYLKEYVLSVNDEKLPAPIETFDCGFTVSQDGSNEELKFNLEYGKIIGEASFDYNFEGGSAHILVQYNGEVVIDDEISGSGSVSFNKDIINPTSALVTITPYYATYNILSNCVESDQITVIRIVVNSPSNEGQTTHNNYNWSLNGYNSPTNIDFVLLESDGVSLYQSITGPVSVGVIPSFGSTIKMQSDKYITDTFDFDPASNSLKYLVSDTLYTESDINTLRPLLNTATPIINPSSGKFESSFVYNNPSKLQYLYLVWDLLNAYSVGLCYSDISGEDACITCIPVNCEVSEWSEWSDCIDGVQTRTRTVVVPAENGGTECPSLIDTRICGYDIDLCYDDLSAQLACNCGVPTVNCEVSAWSEWSECIDGTQSRTRTIVVPPTGGGNSCPPLTETRDCVPVVNCQVSEWSEWSTCDDGYQSRTRTVIVPPSGGGQACPELSETRTCSSINITNASCNNENGSTVTKRFTIAIGNAPATYTIETGTVVNPAGLEYTISSAPGNSFLQVVFMPAVTYGNEFSIELLLKNSTGAVVGTNVTQTVYGNYESFLPSCTPVNCVVSEWSAWSDCVDNVSTRTRTIITQPSGGGEACPTLTESRDCANCEVSEWSAWSTCSDGLQTRTRTIVTEPYNGGTACPTLSETRTCSGIDITDTICNSDGGSTITKRFRIALTDAPATYTIVAGSVINPAGLEYSIVPTPGDAYIQVAFKPALTYGNEFSIQLLLKNSTGVTVGMSGTETLYGNYQSFLPSCFPVNCVVSEWSEWSSCVNNVSTRTRTIITPASGGGTPCPVLTESRDCANCEVSAWSDWSACTDGLETRTRTVITQPYNGGTACPILSETRTCSTIALTTTICNTDGGSTITKRFRISIGNAPATYTIQAGTVVNPAGLEYSIVPTPGDSYLQVIFRPSVTYGSEFSIELLLKNSTGITVGTNVSQTVYGNYQSFLPSCFPVNCVVSEWSAWSDCIGGTQSRTRTIITQPSGGGTPCPPLSETRDCPVDCVVSEWSAWSDCVGGTQSRTRTVITPAINGGTPCPVLSETRDCPVDCVVSEWSAWSACFDGLETRTRTVITPAINGGTPCPVLSETRTCSGITLTSTICNTDGGSTVTKRFRIALTNAPSTYTIVAGTVNNYAGLNYSIVATPGDSYLQVEFKPSITYGNEFSIQLLLKNSTGTIVGESSLQTVYGNYQSFLPGCYPVNCVVSDWSPWSTCTDGTQTRTRTVITPASGGGTPCPVLTETQSCDMPVNCVVSEWSDWSACFDGFQSRTRTIITPASGGGTPCPPLIEYQECEMPVNCVVSEWSAWSTCVDGFQTRTRTVITPASGGGTPCPVLSETQACTVPVTCYPYDIAFGTTANNACVNYSNGTVLPLAINTPDWQDATILYRACATLVLRGAGWYSADGLNRYWDGSAFTSSSQCIF